MDKVLCPRCGKEMVFLPEDDNYPHDAGRYWCSSDGWEGPWAAKKHGARVAAMSRYQPENRVLTLAELDERESVFDGMGEPVYVERKNDIGIWGIVRYSRECMPRCEIVTASSENDGCLRLPRKNYGKAWRCWARHPTDEERVAVGWE